MNYSTGKCFVLLCLLTLLSGISFAKGDKHPQNVVYANRYFEVEDYFLAAEFYNKELEKDTANAYAAYYLAECYRFIHEYEKAELWYGKTQELDIEQFPLSAYYHALMLKTNGQYLKSSKEFEYFLKTYQKSSETDLFPVQARLHLEGCEYALESFKMPVRDFKFTDIESPVNTEYSDFAPTFYLNDSSLVIASSRFDEDHKEVYGRFGEAYLDNYRFEKNDSMWVQISKEASADNFYALNTKYNDGAGVFSSDKNKFYFTRCDEKLVKGLGYNCAIYTSVKSDEGVWGEAIKLNENINPKGEWNAHPALSKTNDTLFFVSKRPGGFGMHDLYYSARDQSGAWGAAVNLGDEVNTQFAEVSPYYAAKQDLLLFASTGHKGFGGLDLFSSKINDGFHDVKNLGLPFNSNRDDHALILGDSIGYLSSNREGGKGSDDVYLFNVFSTNALIAVLKLDTVQSKTVTVLGKLNDAQGNASNGTKVLLTDSLGNVLKTATTNENGEFQFSSLESGQKYNVVLAEEKASLTDDMNYRVENIEVFIHEEEEMNTTSLLAAEKGAPSRVLFENVYFDVNQSMIRPEAKKVLEDLISYSEKNPSLQIEVSAHTDATGTFYHNKMLAMMRGQAAYNFLVLNGVKPSTIVVNAIGEAEPIASNKHEVGRQLNRRIEFHVVGGGSFESNAMAYVVEPATSLDEIADRFGMTVGEIKSMNNIESDEVDTYTALRVKRNEEDVVAGSSLNYTTNSESFDPVDEIVEEQHVVEDGKEVVYLNNTEWNKDVKYNDYHNEEFYTVMPKNTLYSISKLTGVPVSKIVALNDIKDNTITVGQVLRLKEKEGESLGIEVNYAPGSVVSIEGKKCYIVKDGDTVNWLADSFGMSVVDLKRINGNQLPNMVQGVPVKIEVSNY